MRATFFTTTFALCAAIIIVNPAYARMKNGQNSHLFSVDISKGIPCKADSMLTPRLALQLGFLTMSRSEQVARSDVSCIKKLWPRPIEHSGRFSGFSADRSFLPDLSISLIGILRIAPKAVVQELKSDRELLIDWLNSLDHGAYYWEGEGECPLVVEREQIDEALRSVKLTMDEKEVASKIQTRLRHLQCRIPK
jgi:hypothetical protein